MSTPFTWQNRVDSAVGAAESTRTPPMGNPRLTVHFRTRAGHIIKAAAAQRGVTVAGFVRRASLAMAAEVLGASYHDVIREDPTIQMAGGYAPADDPSGRLAGPWEIEALKRNT